MERWIPESGGAGDERTKTQMEPPQGHGGAAGGIGHPAGGHCHCRPGVKGAGTGHGFHQKESAAQPGYPFGTDWMGRDMFVRSLTGLSISIRIGLLAACFSAVVAFIMGTMAACLGRATDAVIGGIIDLVMGIPHILLLILISFAVGKGFWGVLIGVSLTHWTSLARLLRGEVMQLRESQYIQVAKKLGKGRLYIALKHMTPHLLPQLFVGMVLLFPHAILHEASITFLGFGLPPEQPAVGVILSESMKYLVMGNGGWPCFRGCCWYLWWSCSILSGIR